MMRITHHHEERTDPMEFFHADSYEEAWHEVQRLKAEADDATPTLIYRIIRSPYEGFDIVAVDADLYADMVSNQWVDGLPLFPPLKGTVAGGFMP